VLSFFRAFKKGCKEQLMSLKAQIKAIDDDIPTAEKDRMTKIEKLFQVEQTKWQKYRQVGRPSVGYTVFPSV
jgi:hypothetical protein